MILSLNLLVEVIVFLMRGKSVYVLVIIENLLDSASARLFGQVQLYRPDGRHYREMNVVKLFGR